MKLSDQNAARQSKFALNFKSYGLAILVHVVLLGVILFNLFWNPTQKVELGGGQVEPIQAQVIDETVLNQEIEKLKQEEDLKKQQNLAELEKQAEEKRLEIEKLEQEKQQKQELAKQREREEKKAKEVEEKRLAEEARLKELALQKEEEEKKKKEQELAQKKLEEQRKKEEAEKRRLEEEKKKQEALAQKKREEEKRKKEEAEKQRRAKEEADRIAAEEARVRSEAAALFSQYIGPIRAKVTNSWIRPGTVRPGARAKVLVRVSPQGDVLTATMRQGSGDPIFDRSVINAVYKASPLPIPNDARLYPHYRDFVFNFDPPG